MGRSSVASLSGTASKTCASPPTGMYGRLTSTRGYLETTAGAAPDHPQSDRRGSVRFDRDGNVLFTYDAGTAGTDAICDAYALNAADDDDIWVYFYTEFPIVRIRRGEYRTWKLGVAGANALAVRQEQAFLFGDYKKRGLGRVVALEAEAARVVEEVQVEDEGGGLAAWTASSPMGEGDRLFFLKDRQALVLHNW